MQTYHSTGIRICARISKLAFLLTSALLACASSSFGALISYWNFDEGTGTVATDTSGNPNNHNGAFGTGAETPSWVPGRFGNAVGFAWSSSPTAGGKRVIVPFHTELQMNGPITISYWYRMDAATPAGTFPGIMRLGSQSATTGANVGWGFFRTGNMVYKRGNNQPSLFAAMNVGQWYHLALRWDGSTAANNTLAFLNGNQVTFSAANGWSNCTATTVFELGRMDAFDTATLDDLALWNEAVTPGKIRSIYTVPVALNLDYNLANLRAVWSVFDGGPGSTAVVKGSTWSYAASVPGSTADGDAYISGGSMYVVLGSGKGVSAPVTSLSGLYSPGGIGIVDSLALVNPLTVANASLLFDINASTTPGSRVNDFIYVPGDLTILNSTLTVDPLATLPGGTYQLINYTGAKSGSLTLSNNTRYSVTLDDSLAGEIDATVSGSASDLKWNSTTSTAWDLTLSNWLNTGTSGLDRFFQGDSVLFDDTTGLQAGITLPGAVFPKSVTVNSSTRNYSITGTGQIGGGGDGITKSGASILTVSTPNTFIGDVHINNGIFRLGNAGALGATNGQTIVASGATLDLAGNAPGFEAVTVQGAGLGSTGAVINTGGNLVNTGLRGGVTLAGDTTFGGIGRWDVFGGGFAGNGYKLTKVGAPEVALSNLGDTGLGDIEVQQGILTILGNTTLGDPAKALTVQPNAILGFWQNAPTVLNKPIVMNSAIMRNQTSGNTDITTNLGTVTLNGDVTFQTSANIALMGEINGPGNLIKVNAGTLYLGAVNTYTGRTTIGAGRLALVGVGGIFSSPRIDVSASATMDVSGAAAQSLHLFGGQTLSGSGTVAGSLVLDVGATVLPGAENVPATLTITNDLTIDRGTLVVDLAAATTEGSGVNDLMKVGGNVLADRANIMVNPLGLLSVGNSYTLITYTGTLFSTAADFTVINNTRYTFEVNVDIPGKILLVVTGGEAANLTWLGGTEGAENLWDLQTTPNWSDSVGNSSTFFGGDKVVFDDLGLTSTIELVGSLTPASIRLENGTVDYIFQGSGKLSGNSTLTKIFDAKATIANTAVNDYIGATDIQAGSLQVGTGGTFGNLGSGPINNNGTLILNRADSMTFANVISGSGSFVKQSTNLVILPTANPNYSGSITVSGGTIRAGVSNALGNTAGGTIVTAGATLDINAVNLADEAVTAEGPGVGGSGAIINGSGTGQNNALRFVTLTGHTTIGGAGRWDIRANPTASLSTGGNSYNLTKVGANQVSLVDVAVDPALGDINVNGGILSVEIGTGSGDPTKTITVANNATLQFFNKSVVWNKNTILNGGQNILNASGDSFMNGPITLNGTVTFNVGGNSLTVSSPVGGSGALTKATGAGSLWLYADNTYTGPTTISAGALYLGNGTGTGSVRGAIVDNATLGVYRNDVYTLTNPLSGSGSMSVRSENGVILGGTSAVNLAGTVSVGHTNVGKLILPSGFSGTWGNLFLGDSPNVQGDVVQLGGALTVSSQVRIGHWPNNTSSYLMGGGTLALTATPGAVVNQSGVAEQAGILYLGIDGTGIFTQTGGIASAHGIVLDGRGETGGTDTFTLNGGSFIVGPSGLKSGSLDANRTYAINLGGGTIVASGNWTSVLNMTLSGTNGNFTFNSSHTALFSNVLAGVLSGPGGLIKIGSGVLTLTGNDTYQGGTIVTEGTLVVRGSLGSGSGTLLVQGTLAGDGVINDAVTIYGTLAPGLSIGKLTINNSLSLGGCLAFCGGSTIMEIAKTASGISNDLIVASSIGFGGTLRVTASGNPLAEGDTFKLFDAPSFSGSFSGMVLPALPASPPGLFWDVSQSGINGTIRVARPRPSLTIANSLQGIDLSWGDGFTDYTLQVQTNPPGVGITTNWTTLDNPNTNRVIFQIDTNAGSVFYRLLHQ